MKCPLKLHYKICNYVLTPQLKNLLNQVPLPSAFFSPPSNWVSGGGTPKIVIVFFLNQNAPTCILVQKLVEQNCKTGAQIVIFSILCRKESLGTNFAQKETTNEKRDIREF